MTVRSRLVTVGWSGAVVIVALAAAVLAARSTGSLDPLVFVGDAGPLVRWSVPLLRVAADASAALTVGALVVASTMMPARAAPPPEGASSPEAPEPLGAAIRLAHHSAVCWVVAALTGAVFAFADAVGLPLTSPELPAALIDYFWVVDPSRIGLLSAACALAVVVAIGATTRGTDANADGPANRMGLFAVSILAVLGLTLVAQASHSGTSSDHETSIDSLGVHLLAGALWAGGLAALLLLSRALRDDLPVVARRYSAVALWSYVALATSGVLAATTRFGSWQDLLTPYGVLVVVKAAILAVLGLAGWCHRTSTLTPLAGSRRPFARLAVAEVLLMAAAYGVAAGLSRSAPPEPETVDDPSPTLSLTGFPAPPEPAWISWLTDWRVDWLTLTLAVLALGLYAAGLARLRGSGGSWRGVRTVAWVAGWSVFVWATSGAPGVYGRVSLSWHLGQLLAVALVVPALVALGRPAALARDVLARRRDGTVGPREVVERVAGSPLLARVTSPVAAGVLAAGLLVAVIEPVLELTLTTHPGHQLAIAVMFLAGSLLATRLLPVDPDPGTRYLAPAAAVGAFCIGLGLVLMSANRVLAADFFAALEIPWLDPLDEQRAAGRVAAVLGALMLLAAGAAAVVSRRPRP